MVIDPFQEGRPEISSDSSSFKQTVAFRWESELKAEGFFLGKNDVFFWGGGGIYTPNKIERKMIPNLTSPDFKIDLSTGWPSQKVLSK